MSADEDFGVFYLLFEGKDILEEENVTSLLTESYVREVDGKIHENYRDVRKADNCRKIGK